LILKDRADLRKFKIKKKMCLSSCYGIEQRTARWDIPMFSDFWCLSFSFWLWWARNARWNIPALILRSASHLHIHCLDQVCQP